MAKAYHSILGYALGRHNSLGCFFLQNLIAERAAGEASSVVDGPDSGYGLGLLLIMRPWRQALYRKQFITFYEYQQLYAMPKVKMLLVMKVDRHQDEIYMQSTKHEITSEP